ncbi:MAG TPA: VOC family protein [Gammaproteobacteria bacterium]|nr:VOC family protein [Gammaproteobacteria bacterium]
MPHLNKIVPCLWFDTQAEDAAKFYVAIFKDSRITRINYFSETGHEIHGQPAGLAMTVAFELSGQAFTALNGGPHFKFNEAVSLQVMCKTQEEIDYYWEKLLAGGDKNAGQCGWLKDRFGLSWQIVPEQIVELFGDAGSDGYQRAMNAMLQMKKLDINALQRAYDGEAR